MLPYRLHLLFPIPVFLYRSESYPLPTITTHFGCTSLFLIYNGVGMGGFPCSQWSSIQEDQGRRSNINMSSRSKLWWTNEETAFYRGLGARSRIPKVRVVFETPFRHEGRSRCLSNDRFLSLSVLGSRSSWSPKPPQTEPSL